LKIVRKRTLDFQGGTLEGLQIMGNVGKEGVDVETVILTSVNEGNTTFRQVQ